MKHVSISVTVKRLWAFAFALALGASATPRVQAQSFSVIYTFTGGSDGGQPLAGLVMDAAGNLYGTTSSGGTYPSDDGVVFKMTESGQETVLYTFTGTPNGAAPEASLLMDSAGNLYGTTYAGGAHGFGTVFKLSQSNGVWTETVLYSFAGGTDGANPRASLIMDKEGNLYGTTCAGGAYSAGTGATCFVNGPLPSGGGTVFELNKGGKETVLHSFGAGTDGANPWAGVTRDAEGNLYGTTSAGGANAYGTVFELTPVPVSASNPPEYREGILHSFTGQEDGDVPYAGLIFGSARTLYGATTGGGDNVTMPGGGTVFELTRSAEGWNFTVLYALAGWQDSGTYQNVLLDSKGNIYATTHCDYPGGNGTVYELTNSAGSWNYTTLYAFCSQSGCTDGYFSYSNLVFDSQGNLYGTTQQGGANNGVVFKITP
jgi:uncharacterized repeat protein (TIGR03803 family)